MSLMKICKVYCFVPTSHLVEDAKLEKLGDTPFDAEGSSDLWPGSYGEREVSIKILSRYETDDLMSIKVSMADSWESDRSLTRPPPATLVSRGRDMEADVPSEHPAAHRNYTVEGDRHRVPMDGKREYPGLPEREPRGQPCEAGVFRKIAPRFLSDSCRSWRSVSSAYNIFMR